jgi:hypothetical protein
MDIAVTIRTRRKLHVRRTLQVIPTMHTHDMFGEHAGMTPAAIHRIEPALVPAVIGADVAVETFRQAVRAAFELNKIDVLVAINTGIGLLGDSRSRPEQQTAADGGDDLERGKGFGFVRLCLAETTNAATSASS